MLDPSTSNCDYKHLVGQYKLLDLPIQFSVVFAIQTLSSALSTLVFEPDPANRTLSNTNAHCTLCSPIWNLATPLRYTSWHRLLDPLHTTLTTKPPRSDAFVPLDFDVNRIRTMAVMYITALEK